MNKISPAVAFAAVIGLSSMLPGCASLERTLAGADSEAFVLEKGQKVEGQYSAYPYANGQVFPEAITFGDHEVEVGALKSGIHRFEEFGDSQVLIAIDTGRDMEYWAMDTKDALDFYEKLGADIYFITQIKMIMQRREKAAADAAAAAPAPIVEAEAPEAP